MIESFLRSMFNRPDVMGHKRHPNLDKAIEESREQAAADRQKAADAWNATGKAGDNDSDRRFASLMEQ